MTKYKGTIFFNSRLSLRLFKTGRLLARLSLICGIIAGVQFMVRRDTEMPEPTFADAAPTIFLLGLWLLIRIAISISVRRSMRESAAQRGQKLWQYQKDTANKKHRTSFELSEKGKYPNTKRGQERRVEDALALHRNRLRLRLEDVPRVWGTPGTKAGYSLLRDAQKQGQTIVDKTCREYAVSEYAARSGSSELKVRETLKEEDGYGPVSKAVAELYASVHYEYEAYFENHEHSIRGVLGGYSDARGLNGTKRVYD